MICMDCNHAMYIAEEGWIYMTLECGYCGSKRREEISEEVVERRTQLALLASRYGRIDPHSISDYWMGKTFTPTQARW